ncbi:hypothetical protein EVAR_70545_1 [Eumeta japonica]|uniref:Uncharacterized protein n=1 Tax=Eumeta variegata TaxID=151549 RepID=A0A4C1SSN5_EUMVA|nr:hypothetical protein EVAR_70545_1 [Eumeta japonica]
MEARESAWKHARAHGSTRERMEACETAWKHVRVHRSMREHMKARESAWEHVRAHGNTREGRMALRQHQLDLLEANDTAEGPYYGLAINDTL